MKHGFAIHSVLAAVLVVPAVTLETQHPQSLEENLLRTVRALESLAGVQEAVQSGAPEAIEMVLEWTEPAIAGDEPLDQEQDQGQNQEQERLLVALRDEVNRLQSEYDLTQPSAGEIPAIEGIDYPEPDRSRPLPPTTGLDDDARKVLARIQPPSATPIGTTPETVRDASEEGRLSFEPEGYTADSLRLARVLYKQARYQEALELLAGEEGAESFYWRARCFERLGRHDEALKTYREVSALPTAGSLAQRAQEDSEFLQWRLSFEKQHQRKGKGKGKQPR
jgi:tetratricopeptide (TPR) repeat protein